MTDRSIIYSMEQGRSFDFVSFEHDVLVALAATMEDALGGTTSVVGGLVATPTGSPSLTINLTSGRIYQLADADATTVGAIAQDTTLILQQGQCAPQPITLSTSGIGAGQSRWSLIQGQFSQTDVVRASDPNGGVPPFYNVADPSNPLNGQGGSGAVSPTEREGLFVVQVITGTAATTGSEVPPTPTGGWVPLYLIDLSFGQTAITSGEILIAGPSVGTGVPSNYAQAPFLAGLLNSHHGGILGQAPKIKLGSEVQGVLPLGNLASGTGLINIQRLTASGTYNPTAGTNSAIVEGVGGGGGGGSSSAVTTGNVSIGAGGGGGGYFRHYFSTVPTSQAFTIGGAGAGGTGGGGGASGGTTIFGSLQASGGAGGSGAGGSGAQIQPAGVGGLGSGANIINGQAIPGSIGQANYSSGFTFSGGGGSSALGGGGGIQQQGGSNGYNGIGYGAGGGGACALLGTDSSRPGGNGVAGVIIVYEYR